VRYASVCDGIGAAHVAWQPLGWECAWTSEIEPFPSAVVDERWKLKNVGDMTKLTEEQLENEGPISLLVGGTPCQSFSVAGLRKGLEDPRGNLALRFTQLVGVLRPTWVVWENVPGVLSSGGGRDFGTFLGALAELGYGFAYRVLDAQWFGVAQRRRRVFVVAHARDWRRAAAVLFERESVFGNPPTRGASGEKVTGPIAGCSNGGGANGPGRTADDADTLVASAVGFNWQNGGGYGKANDGLGITEEGTGPLQRCNTPAVAFANRTRDGVKVPEVMKDGIVPALTNPGGGGRSDAVNVAVPQGFTYSGYSNQSAWMTGDRTDCLPASGHSDGSHQGVGVVSVRTAQTSANGHGVATDVAHTLDQVQGQAIAFRENQRGEVQYVDPPHALASGGGKPGQGYCGVLQSVAFNAYQRTEQEAAWPLGASDGRKVEVGVREGMSVRRLTPRECERLQGFPDDYTLVTYRNKPAADGPRYKALGNSMAVPVMRWIGERIALVDSVEGSNA